MASPEPEMREHARRSSGVYDNDAIVGASTSGVSLAGESIARICVPFPFFHASSISCSRVFGLLDRGAIPAGFGSHDQAPGQEGGDMGTATAAAATAATDVTSASAAQQPRTPWYKQRKWIIVQVIGAILGIVILFVFLFPVVAAIAQLIINRTAITINTAAILQPQNGSYVPRSHLSVQILTRLFRFQLQLEGVVSLHGALSPLYMLTRVISSGHSYGYFQCQDPVP